MIQFDRMITTIDAHAAGEPLRIITSGFPPLPGATILERRRYLRENLDHLRRMLMLEPRGHSGMYGCLLTQPASPDADFGVIFMHNEGYSTMCGHGIIAVTKVAAQTGLIEVGEGSRLVKIDAPAGRINAYVRIQNGRVVDVCFENVPSFAYALDQSVEVHGLGEISVDIAFGGAFYAYVDAAALGVAVEIEQLDRLVELGVAIKQKVMAQIEISHPGDPDLGFLYGTIICDQVRETKDGWSSKNICIFADAQIDRSPTGTGTSGRLALLHARGIIPEGGRFTNRSILDTEFWGRVIGETRVGEHNAVYTQIGGDAFISGFNQWVMETGDPISDGFRLTGG